MSRTCCSDSSRQHEGDGCLSEVKDLDLKSRNGFIVLAFTISVVVILWPTLISRIGSQNRLLYAPFWSVSAILDGNRQAFSETVGNVLLFVPFGITVGCVSGKKRSAVLIGLGVSLAVEALQWIFGLGSTEIDDVIFNGIGVYTGATAVEMIRNRKQIRIVRRQIIAVLSVVVLLAGLGGVNLGKSLSYARFNDREDGARNLLTLNRQAGRIGNSDVFVEYGDDGTIRISGESNIRTWKQIGSLCLLPGHYVLTGFSGVPENSVGIELEYFDIRRGKYVRLTPDIGPVEEAAFQLSGPAMLRAVIGIYPGGKVDCVARPAVYREDKESC